MKNKFELSEKRILIILFVMFLLVRSSIPVSAYTDNNSAADAQLTFADESHLSVIKQIRLPFPNVSEERIEWDFPYSDEFFNLPPEDFSITMARGSMGLTLSAFRSTAGEVSLQYETYLQEAGFTNIYSFGYDKPPVEDSLSGVIGMKRIGDCTVIAVAPCGQGYGNEWASNFKVGNRVRHEGFNQAAALLEDHLAQYLKNNQIKGKKKLWVSGFSRASAVGNILAADMIENREFDDVYAYLFGVPRTTRQPERYKGIFNICGQYDPVPSVPLQSWGYERYGTDLYTPAQESNKDYALLTQSADEVGVSLDRKRFRNNPEINYQLRLILESLGEFFPDSKAYCDKLQDLLAEAIVNHSDSHVFDLLTMAFERLEPDNIQDQAKIEIFVDYIGYIVGQHLRADQRQIEDGSWDPEEALAANLALEHLPVTYIRWLFSDEDPQKIFAGPNISRKITMIGPVDTTILKDGRAIAFIDKYGEKSSPEGTDPENSLLSSSVFMTRNEDVTLISLPNDAEYYIKIDTDRRSTVTFYDLIISPEKLATEAGRINLGEMRAGSYGYRVAPDTEIAPSPEVIEGHYTLLGSSDYVYSPITVMNDELDATRFYFMSLNRVYRLALNVMIGLVMFLFGCLIMHLVHRHKAKKGHPPFSKWYVIIPHLLSITGLTFLTAMLTYHLFVVDMVRIICASFTVFSIFLLSLRGTLRYKRKSSILLTSFLFILFAITFLFFDRTEKLPFSWFSVTVFAIVVGLLSTAAVLTFREPKDS